MSRGCCVGQKEGNLACEAYRLVSLYSCNTTQEGFQVSRFISLERLIEESKTDYYRILERCSANWHADKNETVPWWNYFLSIIRRAYREFEQKVVTSGRGPAKTELVRQAILAQDMGKVGSGLRLGWSIGYIDAEYKEFIGPTGI